MSSSLGKDAVLLELAKLLKDDAQRLRLAVWQKEVAKAVLEGRAGVVRTTPREKKDA